MYCIALRKFSFFLGLLGINMNSLLSPELCPWYKGPCLFDLLDHLPCPERNPSGPLRIPVFDKMRDLGLYVFGKVESGTLVTGKLFK